MATLYCDKSSSSFGIVLWFTMWNLECVLVRFLATAHCVAEVFCIIVKLELFV